MLHRKKYVLVQFLNYEYTKRIYVCEIYEIYAFREF